jgi:hypothetical protein
MSRTHLTFLFCACILFSFGTAARAQLWSGVLSSDRGIDWTQAGIPGGIPSTSWTQCGPTIPAYTGSPSVIINALNHSGSGYTNCSANQYIQLGAGTFNLSGAIRSVGVSNTELRGMGADQTHLVFSSASTCQGGSGTCLVGFESSDGTYPLMPPANIYNWTAGYAKGSNTITLSDGENIVPNSTWIVLDQCDTGYTGAPCSGASTDNGGFFVCSDIASGSTGCAGNGPDTGLARTHRFQWEIVEAVSCTPACGSKGPTTVTVTPALQHPNWSASQTPQAWLVQPATHVGFRNFSVDGSGTTDTAGVSFNNCSYCWATGIAVLHSYNIGIWLSQDIHNQIENNYVFDAGQHLRYADPTGIKHNGSNNLMQNNIIEAVRPAFLAEGPSNGTVIAYNFTINNYTGDDFLFGGLWEHSTGDDYELYEGNVANQMFEDQIHGTHLMETFYRNLFTGFESCANQQCGNYTAKDVSTSAVIDIAYNRYANYVGNILGTPGFTNTFQSINSAGYIVNTTAWVVGNGVTGTTNVVPPDPLVGTTMFRWGNYDVVSAATRWDTSFVPSALSQLGNSVPTTICTSSASCPPSFYLTSRPQWWPSTIPFPAMGPDVNGGNLGVCSGTLNTPKQFAGVPALTTAQCAPGPALNPSQWGGHVNAIPAMACYLNQMAGPPDGSGSALTFSSSSCYPAVSNGLIPPSPTNLTNTLVQ